MKWKELKIDNLPSDILTGDYEFFGPNGGPGSGILIHAYGIIGELLDGEECFYRKLQSKPPSHEEIITKWWQAEGKWWRVQSYHPDLGDNGRYCIIFVKDINTSPMHLFLDPIYFANLESAEIPPGCESDA